ncbi:1-(5-phosphoribosyl)-5-[(5-phosphoribosylamino)methylideneamino] imidazole-4-carboxamide isomerase [Fictibacillus solisalsi]|uniref:1-(5-phosphoribosyl)-5-[(5-phosphoribosylamino)methylideneamino] imidazole-4-carboxamide isomerase n=1 Tax=Fictibacillus solisalsi TaxID=459525 RepID=A0A1G9XW92_9BACL|nr:1-(5-phosphoribosyl)-5-[(5-phosphoribosylamino)methylideneamino]imidazole-4-carboxamide isomerase [Fictibacillus solisalsi]SDN00435.1 1-(5-phosphoribosyl)-5-[(5-phosphoribosylamino)methylideneamino] imidazole-4-carboxamide isomerase [Fictibacillus solisalsi]
MSEFSLYPAIDMRGGKCVRLLQGDYNQETVYGDSPFEMAKQFAEAGAKWIHMVDLDGAKAGERVNHQHVVRVANELDVSVQIGGGIRNEEDVAFYLKEGVNRVILGSAAISNPEFVIKMLRKYGSQIAIGIDARNGYVATEGWLNTSEIKASELAEKLGNEGAETFIFTDISKDGTLKGPNTEAIGEIAGLTGKNVIASGGVSSLDDLAALKADHRGIGGAIIGKALYTGRFTLQEALEKVK